MPQKIILGVYGTLRKDMPLHSWMDDLKYLTTLRVPYYKMYSIGCPIIIKSEDVNDSVTVELYEGTLEQMQNIIYMEMRAGYKLAQCSEDDIDFYIFEYGYVYPTAFQIESGDYRKWRESD